MSTAENNKIRVPMNIQNSLEVVASSVVGLGICRRRQIIMSKLGSVKAAIEKIS